MILVTGATGNVGGELILGRVLDRSLRFQAQPDDEAHAEMFAPA